MSTQRGVATTTASGGRSLVGLLGDQRAAIVEHLREQGDRSVSELAIHLGISEVATRRHLGVLEDEQLVTARTVNQGRGRPAARYRLTDAATQLFPGGYGQLAGEMLDFLADERGGDELLAFLRWRAERQSQDLRDAVTAEDLHDKLDELAGALSERGYGAHVERDGEGFTLTQSHCAIEHVARDHPEVCAYEAAAFASVLGGDVELSRRQTLADGAQACVCCVQPRDQTRQGDEL